MDSKWTKLAEHVAARVSSEDRVSVGAAESNHENDSTEYKEYLCQGVRKQSPLTKEAQENLQPSRCLHKKWVLSPRFRNCTQNLKNQNLSLPAPMDVCPEQWFTSLTHHWIPNQSVRNEDKVFKSVHLGVLGERSGGPMMNLILSMPQHHNC